MLSGTEYQVKNGQGQNRTADTKIFSLLLYRLSYLPTVVDASSRRAQGHYCYRSRPSHARVLMAAGKIKNDTLPRTRTTAQRLNAATRDSTKSITLASSLTPSSWSISFTPVGLVTFTSVM